MSLPSRALPRAFVDVPGFDPHALPARIELPESELTKFRNVLRLRSGDEVAILPGDGSLVRARLDGKQAIPEGVEFPQTESRIRLTLALALSKPDALEDSIRMATELGAARFILFPSRRSVVQWEKSKLDKKLVRLRTIAREACEVAFRTRLPVIEVAGSLVEVLESEPAAWVLSESDRVDQPFPKLGDSPTLVIGPEGGWDPQEVGLIGDRAVTLGPRVLRVATAVATASALASANR